jgi:hypothetical protein
MDALITAVVFTLLVLIFTVVSILVSSPSSRVGTARAMGAIPVHEAELGAAALVLGALALGIYGKGGFAAPSLLVALVILLDLDHAPSFLGISQPIRPAHSFVFIAVDVAATAIILRRMDFGLVAMSAFAAHLGIDDGTFPPFSPISFQYLQLDPYHVPLLVASGVFAFSAGYLMRRRRGRP